MKRNIVDWQGNILGELELPDGTSEEVWQNKLAPYAVAPVILTQEEKDKQKYLARAAAKDKILAEMATENMSRVRSGVWTVPDLVALTQDPEIQAVLSDVYALSFELAANKLTAVTNPLITPEIKTSLLLKLQSHFY